MSWAHTAYKPACPVPSGPQQQLEHISVKRNNKEDGKPVLKDFNLAVEKSSLVAVVGTVGAGKSSLCSAIPLGEMEKQWESQSSGQGGLCVSTGMDSVYYPGEQRTT